MTDAFADDSWDELTRELGVEKSPAPLEPPAEDLPSYAQDASEFEPQSEDDTFDGGLEPEGDAPDGAEAPGDEQPGGTGKKRRRRRRRRKKLPGEADSPETGAPEAAAVPVRSEPEYDDGEYETGPGSENELAAVPLAADEDTAGEALRDLIANWNVPSWDSIVTGLYRPER